MSWIETRIKIKLNYRKCFKKKAHEVKIQYNKVKKSWIHSTYTPSVYFLYILGRKNIKINSWTTSFIRCHLVLLRRKRCHIFSDAGVFRRRASYYALRRGTFSEFLTFCPRILSTATLWRRGQAKPLWPCGERWAHSARREGQLRSWSMAWLGLAVMRGVLYMKDFIYMWQRTSFPVMVPAGWWCTQPGPVSQLCCSGFTWRNGVGSRRGRINTSAESGTTLAQTLPPRSTKPSSLSHLWGCKYIKRGYMRYHFITRCRSFAMHVHRNKPALNLHWATEVIIDARGATTSRLVDK